MRHVVHALVVSMMLAIAAPLWADGGAPPPPPPTKPREAVTNEPSQREQAERHYADAYDEIKKADKDLAKGKEKNAKKKYEHALERCKQAVELDEKYFEAWNLVGYSSRKLGDYDASLAAYQKSLKLNPRYVPAREYLGEAYVEMGKIDEARGQLAVLTELKAEKEAATLSKRIETWIAAHPKEEAKGSEEMKEAKPASGAGEEGSDG